MVELFAPPLDELVSRINAAGYRVNNLFQLHVGGAPDVLSWQCNVTDGKEFSQFTRADTMQGALEKALGLLPKPKPAPELEPSMDEDPFA